VCAAAIGTGGRGMIRPSSCRTCQVMNWPAWSRQWARALKIGKSVTGSRCRLLVAVAPVHTVSRATSKSATTSFNPGLRTGVHLPSTFRFTTPTSISFACPTIWSIRPRPVWAVASRPRFEPSWTRAGCPPINGSLCMVVAVWACPRS